MEFNDSRDFNDSTTISDSNAAMASILTGVSSKSLVLGEGVENFY